MSPVLSEGNPDWTIKTINVARGEAISVYSNGAVSATTTPPSLILKPITNSSKSISLPANVPIPKSDESVEIIFPTLPNLDLGPGRYEPTLLLPVENGTPKKERISVQGSQDGSLGITRNPGDPAITSVSPSGILFPAMDGKYPFTVNGDGFSPIGNDNKLIIATNDTDEGKTQDVCWRNSKLEQSKDQVYNDCVIKTNASVNFIDTQHR